jgi:hypothetical protein
MRSDIKIDHYYPYIQIYHFDEIYLILPKIVDGYQRGNQNPKDKQ